VMERHGLAGMEDLKRQWKELFIGGKKSVSELMVEAMRKRKGGW
jgi:hypothetical protein